MSAMVQFSKERNLKFDEIKLESIEKLYDTDSEMLQNELGDYSGKQPAEMNNLKNEPPWPGSSGFG